jgi:hypothetical protein
VSSSSILDRHPDYAAHEAQWRRINDVLSGTDAVRANARDYIPLTVEHQRYPEAFNAMIARTSFTNYTARAVDGLEGLIFRKDQTVEVPYRYKARLDNINNAGDSINTFCKKVVREVLTKGRVGIYVDALPSDQQTYDDPASLLPYLTIFTAENITNWRPRISNGRVVPDQIILREFYSEPQEFGSVTHNRYRVLQLDEDGRYRVRLFEQGSDGGDFALASEYYPTTGSAAGFNYLNHIPFVFIGPLDLSMDVRRSPILDLVDANLSLFQLESLYSTALFNSAQPTPVISGWQDGVPGNFQFGGGNVWLLPPGCTAEIMEFKGHGLSPMENAKAAKVAEIAELGARLVQNVATSAETAEAARIRQHSQTSVIGSLARTVSDGIKVALEAACKWAVADGKTAFELNQDFLDAMMAPQMMLQIVNAHNAGLMTTRDVAYNLLKGELLEPGRSLDEIVNEMERQKPLLMGQPDPAVVQFPQRQAGAKPPKRQRRGGTAADGEPPTEE